MCKVILFETAEDETQFEIRQYCEDVELYRRDAESERFVKVATFYTTSVENIKELCHSYFGNDFILTEE